MARERAEERGQGAEKDGGGQAAPGAVPAVPAADPRGGPRPGPRGPRADRRHPGRPPPSRVPVLRSARDRQDVHGEDPREDGELRYRSHRRALRRVRPVHRHPGGHASRRGGDRRRVARGGGGRARAPGEGAHGARAGPREGLHHRRGTAPFARSVRRAVEGVRGAALRRSIRPRHHRAPQDARHDRRTVPAVRLPSAHDGGALGAPPEGCRIGRRHARRLGGSRDREALRGLCAGCVVAARPGRRARWSEGRRRRDPGAARRAAERGAGGARRCGGRRRRADHVRGREPARPGRAGPPQRHQRDARPLPGPLAREDGPGTGGPPRHPGRRIRGSPHPGGEVHGVRARPGHRATARGAERHAMDDVAAALPRAGVGAGDDPRDRPVARGHAVEVGAAGTPRQPRARLDRPLRGRGAGARARSARPTGGGVRAGRLPLRSPRRRLRRPSWSLPLPPLP